MLDDKETMYVLEPMRLNELAQGQSGANVLIGMSSATVSALLLAGFV